METEKIAREVNYLIIHNLDAQEAYIEAASIVENTELCSTMLDEADKRGSYARELQREVKNLGENPAEELSMSAMWNRIVLEIKGFFSKPDENRMIEECKKGDDDIVLAYDTVIQLGDKFLPSRIYNIIKRQRKEIGLTYQALLKFHEQQLAH